ncbi:MAG TPA: glycosyltransferase [Edaphobacter sp.]|nr:glycosyltransferase [Edaphobacter sp.]
MPDNLRIAYFVHSLRSDWNNGNAHFLRGLIREIGALGHEVLVFEPRMEWSIENLLTEVGGKSALAQFEANFPDIRIYLYEPGCNTAEWHKELQGFDVVAVHEWNPPALTNTLLSLRDDLGFRMLFHDTHHRATSSPEQIRRLSIDRFDGVIAFGEALRMIYKNNFGLHRVWTLHEAADTTLFHPFYETTKHQDVVWIGNWGDGERSEEIREYLLRPAAAMQDRSFAAFGVRYPREALKELCTARVRYGGYLPNLAAPLIYAESRVTVHVPRQQYVQAMSGIPTIRVFEALACGIPLISAPWTDTEGLFREGDLVFAADWEQMCDVVEWLLDRPDELAAQGNRGREIVLARHTCTHRAGEFEGICREVLR